MKQALLVFAVFLTVHLSAQPPEPTPGAASYIVTKVPLTNQFRLYGTNLLPTQIGPLLAQLQNNLEQLLPSVAEFNNKFDFATFLAQFQTNESVGVTTDLSTNLSSLLASNVSNSLAENLSTNISTPTPPVKVGDLAVPTPPPGPTGLPNSFGLPPGVTGAMPANYPIIVAAVRDSLRKLIVLQGEIERMLPLVADLNGAGINVAPILNGPANVAPPAINIAPQPPPQFQPPILSPTGR